MITNTFANEIEWAIGCSSPRRCIKCRSNVKYDDKSTYDQKCCLPVGDEDEDFVINCNDTYGDGWHGAYLQINGKNYCEQFLNGSRRKETLQNEFQIKGRITIDSKLSYLIKHNILMNHTLEKISFLIFFLN